MQKPLKPVIASHRLIVTKADSEHFEVTLEIGTPYPIDGESEEWACPVSLSPLYARLHDAHGGDSLQALCLAISLALDLLKNVVEEGGTVRYSTGEDISFESYAFGVAVKK